MAQPPAPSFAIAALDAAKVEDPRGTTSYTFTVTRAGDLSGTDTLAYAAAGSGANPAGPADFVGSAYPSGAVTFAPGETSKTVAIPVQGSPAARPNPGFTVTLSSPAGAPITTASADGLIRTDDADTTPAAFAARFTPAGNLAPVVSSLISTALAKRAGAAPGTVALSSGAAGTFRAPVAGVANAAVAAAPAAGASLALPSGYDALAVQGGGAATLSDAGTAGAVLVGNAAGDTFASTGADAVLTGGAGNDTYFVSGSAQVSTGAGMDTLFAFGAASVDINFSGDLTAVLAGGSSGIFAFGGRAVVYGGAGTVDVRQLAGSVTLVGGDGRVTVRGGLGICTVFGGKGGLDYTSITIGSAVIVGGSGAINVQAGAAGGQFWGSSGQDVIRGGDGFNVLAGTSGDRLYSGGGSNFFLSRTGGVLMDGSASRGQDAFFGGSGGVDTFICGAGTSLIGTGTGSSTVQLGAGKATVYAFGNSTITSGTGSADIVYGSTGTQLLLNAVSPGSTRVFALFNFVPGTEHVTLQQYNPNAAAYALANQVNDPGYTTLTLPDQTRILLLGVGRADASVFG